MRAWLAVIAGLSAGCLQDSLVVCADGHACPAGAACIADPSPDGPFCSSNTCGNGTIEPGLEDCEPGVAIDETCETFDFYGGELSCNPITCRFDTVTCTGTCGDNVVDVDHEACDGTAPILTSCTSLGGNFEFGRPACTAGCTLDVSTCGTRGFERVYEGTTGPGRFCAYEQGGDVIVHLAEERGLTRVTSAGAVALPGVAPDPINDLACNENELFAASYGLARYDYTTEAWSPVLAGGAKLEHQMHDLAEFGSEFGGVGYGGTIVTGTGTNWTYEQAPTAGTALVRLTACYFSPTGNGIAVAATGEFYLRGPTSWFPDAASALVGTDHWMWGGPPDDSVLVAKRGGTQGVYGLNDATWELRDSSAGPIVGQSASSVFISAGDGRMRHFDGALWSSSVQPTGLFDQLWLDSRGRIWAVVGAELLRASSLWFVASIGGSDMVQRSANDGSRHAGFALASGGLWFDGQTFTSPQIERLALFDQVVFGVGFQLAGRIDVGATTPTWEYAPALLGGMHDIVAVDATHAFAVGDNGKAIAYTDTGWQSPVDTGATTVSLYGIARTPQGELIAVGAAGTIVTSMDDGGSWSTVDHGLSLDDVVLRAIWVDPAGVPYVVGTGGTILRRAGGTWEAMPSPTTRDLTTISGDAANNIVAAGKVVLLHFDGVAWTGVRSPVAGTTYTSVAVDGDHVFAATRTSTYVLYAR